MSTMTNNIARDICQHYEVELPLDAHYKVGGLDFRNDCGEAISSCMNGLDKKQLRILAGAENILDEAKADLILAETDEQWKTVQEETILKLNELGEPEVFRAYQQQWDAAAAVIVPIVLKKQAENGIAPYTPDRDEKNPETEAEGQQP